MSKSSSSANPTRRAFSGREKNTVTPKATPTSAPRPNIKQMRQLMSRQNRTIRPTSEPADVGPIKGMATEGGNTSVKVAMTMNTPPVAKAAFTKAAMKHPRPTMMRL